MARITVITPTIREEGLAILKESLDKQTFKDFEWIIERGDGKKHDLNAAYNRLIKQATGELIVSAQDWLKIPEDGLEQFWRAFNDDSNTLFTAPVGKTTDWKDVRWDWRIHPDAFMDWQRWEIDWGAAPKDALYDVGGFDEALDEFWSSDNVSVGWRAHLKGYAFKHLPDNKAIALDHDRVSEHPFRKNYNPDFNNYRMRQVEMGELTIDYLHGNA